MGRHTKLTAAVQDKIVSAIASGNYQEIAARYAGIDPATFYRWMERGASDDAPDNFRKFREAVESAKAQAEVRSVALIQRAAQDGTWQAAAWYLERSAPARWSRYGRVEVSGPAGGPVPVEVSVEELQRKIDEFLGSHAPVEDEPAPPKKAAPKKATPSKKRVTKVTQKSSSNT